MRRVKGSVASTIINECDMMILEDLAKIGMFTVMSLQKRMRLAPIAYRVHIDRLLKYHLISKIRIPKRNMFEIRILPLGLELLKLYKKMIGG